MGFVRRYGFFPGNQVITQIEGVIIIDQPPPGASAGVGVGVAGLVGEFADMTFATAVDSSGNVTTSIRPVEVFSSQDMINKVGGFDETIGDFGRALGNGFQALRNKQFSRLILMPVNLCSNLGVRYLRVLPLCTASGNAAPVVPVQAGTIAAGREFRAGPARLRVGARVSFTNNGQFASGVGGQTVAGASAATQKFTDGDEADQVWQVAAAGPTFVDETANFNSAATGDWVVFPPASAIGDYAAFGSSVPFGTLTVENASGVQGTTGVVVWEYWNGSAWAALQNVVDGTSSFTAALSASPQTVTFTVPPDWAASILNASPSLFYVRARIMTDFTVRPTYSQGWVGGTDWSTIVRPDGTIGAAVGDVLVIGFNNAGSPSTDAGTYRVQSTPASGIFLVLERLDGASFAFAGAIDVPWRLHLASDADSAPVLVPGATAPGGYAAASVGGYTVPSRPLTNFAGGSTDGTWTAGTTLSPAVAPPALTGSSWDPLSGLEGRIMPTGTFSFTAAVQGINAANSPGLDAAYSLGLAASLMDSAPASDIDIIWCARKSSNIRSALKVNELTGSENGKGRMAIVSPELTNVTTLSVIASGDPGVGANRDEGLIYSWPGAIDSVPEAVAGGIVGNSPGPFRLKTADGLTTIDGNLDESFDSYVASILSNLNPENNPGQSAPPIPTVLASVLGLQRGITTPLAMSDYIALRANGIAALRIDKTVGPQVQSGVTTSLIAGQTTINRRRFANFAEDSLASILMPFDKLILTNQVKDSAVGEVNAFLNDLLSPNNPAAQRIVAYQIDDVSGNTPDLEALGIFVIIVRIQMLPTADFIVLQAQIGQGVQITQAA